MSDILLTICATSLPALVPVLYPLFSHLFKETMKVYKRFSKRLEKALAPFDGIRSLIFGFVCMGSLGWFWIFVTGFNKISSTWFNTPVWIYAAICAIFVTLILVFTNWFTYREEVTEWATMLMLVIFLVSSTLVGVFLTENGPRQEVYSYDSTISGRAANQILYYSSYYAGDTIPDTDSDSTDDGNGWIMIIGVGFVCASAVFPHFWFLSGAVLWTMMTIVFLREIIRQLKYGFDWSFQQ